MANSVRVRMAPSPTGRFHIGSARTTLFNYLYAQKHNGTFVLRIEDTDPERSTKEFEQDILKSLRWLGLDWDEGPEVGGDYSPYHQSQRTHIYKDYAQKMLDSGKAYLCFCTPEELAQEREKARKNNLTPIYSGKCRSLSTQEQDKLKAEGRRPAIRFQTPGKKVVFQDLIQGEIEFDTSLIGDFVIAKADGSPLYNFACVIDDYEMKITDVIRGEDHIPNTPKQILLYEALDLPLPNFGHIPLILNEDRSKMSKRKNKTYLWQYKEDGYLPEALVNFLALLGWATTGNQEVYSKKELIEAFSLADVRKSGSIFDKKKLLWFNGYYIRQLSKKELLERLKIFLPDHYLSSANRKKIELLLPEIQPRLKKLTEIKEQIDYLFNPIQWDMDSILKNAKPHSPNEIIPVLKSVKESLENLSSWEKDLIEECLRAEQKKSDWKTRAFFMTLRLVATGQTTTPPLFITLEALGKETTIQRLEKAIQKLEDL